MRWNARKKREGWMKVFVWFPVKTWEDEWLWLEYAAKNVFGKTTPRYASLDAISQQWINDNRRSHNERVSVDDSTMKW